MAKESLYFSHDFNARNDKKIAALVREFKSSGYGIYWCTAEMLHEEGGELELDELTFSAISKDLNEDFELIKLVIEKCIYNYKLFKISDQKIYSERASRNLDKMADISTKRRKAAFAKHNKANDMQMHANADQMDTDAMQNDANKEINKKRKKEKDRGESFSADGLYVIFPDGSKQELGQGQQMRFREGSYQPHYIKKGEIE